MNEGGFIPETIETALQPGYKPPYYRNMFLSNAMTNLYMIDANAMGIPTVFEIQRRKFFPLPTYDLSVPNRVKVTVYGKILDPNYTRLLNHEQSLNIQTVFLLDKVQKRQEISAQDAQKLRQAGLIEGKYPHIFVSFSIAKVVGKKTEYIRNRGLENSKCKMFILETLEKCGPLKLYELLEYVDDMLPQIYEPSKRRRKLSNLLQAMKIEGTVDCIGHTVGAKWYAVTKG
jgi:ATP-dependent DNA helicase RecG